MRSPVYWHPKIYRAFMKALYGRYYTKRFQVISEEIGSRSVLDICCGDCAIWSFLTNKQGYLGLDINPVFVKDAWRRGIQARVCDVAREEWPRRESVLILGSLYQFIPHHEELIKKAFVCAQELVILAEPIRNLASSGNRLISFLARNLTNINHESLRDRLRESQLLDLCARYGAKRTEIIGRDMIAVFEITPARRQGFGIGFPARVSEAGGVSTGLWV